MQMIWWISYPCQGISLPFEVKVWLVQSVETKFWYKGKDIYELSAGNVDHRESFRGMLSLVTKASKTSPQRHYWSMLFSVCSYCLGQPYRKHMSGREFLVQLSKSKKLQRLQSYLHGVRRYSVPIVSEHHSILASVGSRLLKMVTTRDETSLLPNLVRLSLRKIGRFPILPSRCRGRDTRFSIWSKNFAKPQRKAMQVS